MVIRRIGALSLAKVQGALSALLGLIIGAFYALFFLLAAVFGFAAGGESGEGTTAGGVLLLFGVGSIIIFPILLAVAGFIGGLITSLLYNVMARFVGGIELDMEQRSNRVY